MLNGEPVGKVQAGSKLQRGMTLSGTGLSGAWAIK